MPEHRSTGGGPDLPPQVTTPLLTLVTQQSLDEEYLSAAERRIASGEPRRRSPRRTTAVAIAVFGLLGTVAAVQTARNADVEDAGRNTLVARIEDRRGALAGQEARAADLRAEISTTEEQNAALTRLERRAVAELRRLQARTGFVAVRGPGIRVVVDDAPDGTNRVRKEDLFLVVNGLWQAGAEAISLNGRRLTAQTSINNSGTQINVDLASVRAPYVLMAIGNTRSLQSDLVETGSFARFSGLRSQYGFELTMQDEDSIELGAARLRRLVSVESRPTTPARRGRNEEGAP